MDGRSQVRTRVPRRVVPWEPWQRNRDGTVARPGFCGYFCSATSVIRRLRRVAYFVLSKEPKLPWGGPIPMLENESLHQHARAGRKFHVTANILFLACLLSSFSVWAEAANTSFSPPVSYTVGQAPSEVVVDDINGDGIPDLVVLSVIRNGLSVLLGKGDGTFQAAINYPLPSGSGPLAAGDFNGDGRLDLLVTDSNGSELTVLLGNGDGTFRFGGTVRLTESPLVVAMGDFNGDGRGDVAVLESSPPVPDELTIFLGDGQGNLQSAASYSISGIRSSIVVKDLNSDNKQDLVMAVGNHVGVLRGN